MCIRDRVDSEHCPKLIPTPPTHAYPHPTSPRGAAIRRHAAWRGGGGACGRVCTPDSGGCGNRPGRTTAPVRGASLGEATRRLRGGRRSATRCGEPACPVRSRSPLRPTEARPAAFKNADKRSATGRADGGSIHPRRVLAPVPYTHLDVYKRQSASSPRRRIPPSSAPRARPPRLRTRCSICSKPAAPSSSPASPGPLTGPSAPRNRKAASPSR